ncbi:unnamed protein product [Pylaiella littoralis]
MVLVMWPWATPTATWTQTRRTCLGRHHHQRRKDGMETPSSTTSDDDRVCFSFFCLLRLPGLLVRCRQHSREQLTAVSAATYWLLVAAVAISYKWGGRRLNTMS